MITSAWARSMSLLHKNSVAFLNGARGLILSLTNSVFPASSFKLPNLICGKLKKIREKCKCHLYYSFYIIHRVIQKKYPLILKCDLYRFASRLFPLLQIFTRHTYSYPKRVIWRKSQQDARYGRGRPRLFQSNRFIGPCFLHKCTIMTDDA